MRSPVPEPDIEGTWMFHQALRFRVAVEHHEGNPNTPKAPPKRHRSEASAHHASRLLSETGLPAGNACQARAPSNAVRTGMHEAYKRTMKTCRKKASMQHECSMRTASARHEFREL